MIVLRNRPATNAMPIQSAAARTRGMAGKDLVEHRGRRTGDRFDPQHLQRARSRSE